MKYTEVIERLKARKRKYEADLNDPMNKTAMMQAFIRRQLREVERELNSVNA